MAIIKTCRECEVPLTIGKNFTWHTNGAIKQTHKPGERMVFYDSEVFSSVFNDIERTIGMPIDRIIIESSSRAAMRFVRNLAPSFAFKLVRYVGFRRAMDYLCHMAKTYGYGDVELIDFNRRRGPDYHLDFKVRYPANLPIFLGIQMGAAEVIEGEDAYSDYEQLGDEEFKTSIRLGEHLVELKERLREKEYVDKPGHIELKRCAVCGVPLKVAEYQWDLQKGTIYHPYSGERMAFFSPGGFDAIFDDLENELGEDIASIVSDAWKKYIRDKLKKAESMQDFDSLKSMMAVMGLGNLVAYEAEGERMSMTIESSCFPRLVVGFAQGFFEMTMNGENSICDWSLDELEGTIRIEVHSA